jgi:Tfp pilus assembly protein PilN
MGITLAGAAGTFAYSKYLETVSIAKDLKLKESEKNINIDTVEEIIRLRSRIQVASNVLDRHVRSSQFFDVLERITLQNVRCQSMSLNVSEDRAARIEMHGVARSFNALAAQSAAFAAEKQIKRAIFSGITADKNGLVKFALQAELTPRLTLVGKNAKETIEEPAPNIATTTPFEAVPQEVASTTKKATTTP